MLNTFDAITALRAESGKNKKLEILKANADDDLREFLYQALEPTMVFWIKKIPAYTQENDDITLSEAMYELTSHVATRELTGNAAIDFVANLLSQMTPQDAELLERVILKDPKIGMSAKSINKVWPGLITEKIYMRCNSFNEKNLARVTLPGYAQLKADGMFVNIIKRAGKVQFLSRNMKPMDFKGFLVDDVKRLDLKDDFVVHGEALVVDDNSEVLDRKTGNGILSKAIKGTMSNHEASRVILKVWDLVPYRSWRDGKCDYPYDIRFATLRTGVNNANTGKIALIDTLPVRDLTEAYQFFGKMLAAGHEGCILKDRHGMWKNHTSPLCVKMKKKDPADLICTGVYPFDKKTVMRGQTEIDTSKWIGGLNLESADGRVVVNSGSGLNDELRAKPAEYFINHVWEIEYNELITAKGRDTYSLFLPIIKERRDDKDEADTLEVIKERAAQNRKSKK